MKIYVLLFRCYPEGFELKGAFTDPAKFKDAYNTLVKRRIIGVEVASFCIEIDQMYEDEGAVPEAWVEDDMILRMERREGSCVLIGHDGTEYDRIELQTQDGKFAGTRLIPKDRKSE